MYYMDGEALMRYMKDAQDDQKPQTHDEIEAAKIRIEADIDQAEELENASTGSQYRCEVETAA